MYLLTVTVYCHTTCIKVELCMPAYHTIEIPIEQLIHAYIITQAHDYGKLSMSIAVAVL